MAERATNVICMLITIVVKAMAMAQNAFHL
jgi:hypothetical protein